MDSPKKHQPTMYMLAGPNGAGKSTLYEAIIKHKIAAPFINADIIQKEEMDDQREEAAYHAAKIAEKRREEYLKQGKSFVSESTFSHPSKLALIDRAINAGFRVVIYHINVSSPDLSVARVASRVKHGGHKVPEHKIRERYERNQEFIRSAVSKADRAFIFDNSTAQAPPSLAIGFKNGIAERVSNNLPSWARSLYKPELKRHSSSRLNAPAASYADLQNIASKLSSGEEESKVYIPNSGENAYSGKIVGESSLHYLQKTVNGRYIAHFKSALGCKVTIGQAVQITYQSKYKAQVIELTE